MIKEYFHVIYLPKYTLYIIIFTSLRNHDLGLCETSDIKIQAVYASIHFFSYRDVKCKPTMTLVCSDELGSVL